MTRITYSVEHNPGASRRPWRVIARGESAFNVIATFSNRMRAEVAAERHNRLERRFEEKFPPGSTL